MTESQRIPVGDPEQDAPSRSEHERVSRHMAGNLLAGFFAGAKGDGDQPEDRDYGKRYEVRSVLGEGGQGRVLAVYDRVLDREVALKALKAPVSVQREKHLAREARISGLLEHPNIPPTYDLGMDESGAPFFVMRKVEGVSFDEVLRANREARKLGTTHVGDYSRLRLINIFLQVCNAISYAHSRGILHLDIKPQNVRLGGYGEVFVLDWGFAAKVEETSDYFGGTPLYIAPERLRREHSDERADIFSLGVLLYRVLTYERPKDMPRMPFPEFRKTASDFPVIPPRERDPSVPRELDAIVMKAMAEDKDARYQSVRELEDDLQRFLDGLPVAALPEHVLGRMWKFYRRHSVMVVLVTALVLTLGIGGVAGWQYVALQQRQKEEDLLTQKARIPFERAKEHPRDSMRQLRQVRALLSQAITIHPRFSAAYYERGKIHMSLHNREEALTDFSQALRLNPAYNMAHYQIGRIYMDMSRDKELSEKDRADALTRAEAEFEDMRRIDPDDEYSNLGLAWLHERHGRYEQALRLCDKVEERSPAITEVHLIRGLIYGNRDSTFLDLSKALDAYNQYLSGPHENAASAYTNRGGIYYTLKQYDEALADYNRALDINPEYFYALNDRGWILYSQKKNYAAALADFNRATEIRPEYYWTYVNLATVYEAQGEWEQAEMNYNWAYDLKPGDWRISQRLAFLNLRLRRPDAAMPFFDRALTLAGDKDRGLIRYQRGAALYCQGLYKEAKVDFSTSIATGYYKPIYPALLRHVASLRMGESLPPQDMLPYAESLTEEKPWLIALVKCWMGVVTPQQVRKAAVTPEAQCEVEFYLAMVAVLLDGDVDRARTALKKCRATGVILYLEYLLAEYELDRIDAIGNKEGSESSGPVPTVNTQDVPPEGVIIHH